MTLQPDKEPRDTEHRDAAARRLRRRPLGRYRYVRLRWRLLFALIDALGWCLLGPARLAERMLRKLRPPATPRSILVVQLDHFGDAVLSTGFLRALGDYYPNASIEVLAAPWNRDILAACPEVDRLHVMQSPRFSRTRRWAWLVETLRWGWKLRRRRFDLAIDVRGEFPQALILWLCGARRRLGWRSGGGGFLLTDSPLFVQGRHEVDSRRALLETLGAKVGDHDVRPSFQPSDAARRWVDEWLDGWPRRSLTAADDRSRSSPKRLVVLHLGAGTPAKRWPSRHWGEVARRLVVAHRCRVVLIGDGADCRAAQEVIAGSDQQGLVDAAGKLNIDRLAALFARAALVVGADSGPAHLAAAVGAPVVALFSGTNDPKQWRPWGESVCVLRHAVACSPCHRQVCPLADHPCMNQLTPEVVLQTVAGMLDSIQRIENPIEDPIESPMEDPMENPFGDNHIEDNHVDEGSVERAPHQPSRAVKQVSSV